MNFKKILLAVVMCVLASSGMRAQTTDIADRLFAYPEMPEECELLQDRANFFVQHFWDRCNHSTAIKQRDRFKDAFGDWVSLMPYADAEVVHGAIADLLAQYNKDAKNLVTLVEIAEDVLYNPDGEYTSDELFIPFAKALVDHKKVSSAQKARVAHELKILEGSANGVRVPNITLTLPNGSKARLYDLTRGRYTLLFINDPTCDDCALARVRLSADAATNSLIDDKQIYFVSIYPDEPDDEWRLAAGTFNPRWIVGASAEVDENFDLRFPPVFYYVSPSGVILSKEFTVDGLLDAFHRVKSQLDREKTAEQ